MVLLLAPASAQAATFCVSKPSCSGTPQPGLQQALDAAAATAEADRIEIGPGTFQNGPTGFFTNVDGSQVTIVGSGDATVLTAGDLAPAGPPATLTIAEENSTVSDLRIAPNSLQYPIGLDLAGTAERVSVVSAADSDPQLGVTVRAGGVFRRGLIDLRAENSPSVVNGAGGLGRIEDSTVRSQVGLTGMALARRVRLESTLTGVSTFGGATTLDQALIKMTGTGTGIALNASGAEAAVTAKGVTLIGNGTGKGVEVLATSIASPPAANGRLTIAGSVLRGFETPLSRQGSFPIFCAILPPGTCPPNTADLEIRYSSYDTDKPVGGLGGPGQLTEAENLDDVDARFRGPDDFRLQADSPLIDRGDPAPLVAGESPTDLDGLPRVVRATGASPAPRRDMGAFEVQSLAPLARIAIAPAQPVAGEPVTFSATGSNDPEGGPLSFFWEFEGGVLTASEPVATRRFNVPGTYAARLTVTDPAGLKGIATRSFTVRRSTDTVPPELTGLSLSSRRFRSRGRRGGRSPLGTTFRFTLSEEARVAISIERRTRGRRVGRRCRKETSRNRKRRRCTRYVKAGSVSRAATKGRTRLAFSGRLRGRPLPAGRYRARIVATDAAGNRSRTRTISFTIVAPPRARR